MVVRRDSSRGVSAVGIFLYFGTAMACLAGTTLIWRGTALDRVWILNAPAYRHLAPLGRIVGDSLSGTQRMLPGRVGSDAAFGDGDWRWGSSLLRFWEIWSIFLWVILCEAEQASLLRVHCCFIFCAQRSEPLLSVARCRVCDDECGLSDNGTAWHDDKLWG